MRPSGGPRAVCGDRARPRRCVRPKCFLGRPKTRPEPIAREAPLVQGWANTNTNARRSVAVAGACSSTAQRATSQQQSPLATSGDARGAQFKQQLASSQREGGGGHWWCQRSWPCHLSGACVARRPCGRLGCATRGPRPSSGQHGHIKHRPARHVRTS